MSAIKWTEARISRMQKEGRGQGEGEKYKPWLEVTDISSWGLSHRTYSEKTGRIHHFLSQIEKDFHTILDWSSEILDIREQYPLPRSVTREVAVELGIKHPCYPGTHVETVMTVDFVVTRMRDGQEVWQAFDTKHASAVEDARTVEKLEISRHALAKKDVVHHLVCHSEIPKTKVNHLQWILSGQVKPGETQPVPGFFQDYSARMLADLTHASRQLRLNDYCSSFDERFALQSGTGLRLAKLLMCSRELVPDFNQPDLCTALMGTFTIALPTVQEPQLRAMGGRA